VLLHNTSVHEKLHTELTCAKKEVVFVIFGRAVAGPSDHNIRNDANSDDTESNVVVSTPSSADFVVKCESRDESVV